MVGGGLWSRPWCKPLGLDQRVFQSVPVRMPLPQAKLRGLEVQGTCWRVAWELSVAPKLLRLGGIVTVVEAGPIHRVQLVLSLLPFRLKTARIAADRLLVWLGPTTGPIEPSCLVRAGTPPTKWV